MRRTGRPSLLALLGLFALVAAGDVRAEEPDFYQTVDRAEVGTDDTFRLNVVIMNAPPDATVKLGDLSAFEVLSKTPVDSTSIQLNAGGSQIQRVRKWVIVLRPRRAGQLKIGPSELDYSGKKLTADGIVITAKKGRVTDPGAATARPQRPDPFRDLFGGGSPFPPGFEDDPFGAPPSVDIPTSDSDLFIRTYVDKKEAFVGEQITLSVYVFSRVDLSSVDSVNLPKLEGFWSEDIDTPQTLTGESRILNGVPYRAYLLKRKAIFPLKSGVLPINAVEGEITTGHLFAGRRIKRIGNKLELKIKPLPPGAPQGFATTHVGRWHLRADVNPTEVKLGEPINVKVTLEGIGNVKNIPSPLLKLPPSFKVFDPTTRDKPSTRNGQFGGKRTQDYLVMPQQTGSFTIPALTFPYFDPDARSYKVARTQAVLVRVLPGTGGATGVAQQGGPGTPDESAPKNLLTTGGIHPVRHAADFSRGGEVLWKRRWFVPAVLSPLGLWLALGVVGFARGRFGREDEGALRRKKAKDARRRLAAAEKLKAQGATAAFYAEVEKALVAFLDAKLGLAAAGLTRDALMHELAARGVPAERSAQILAVLETCELGRFAPGASEPSATDRVLDDAEAAMEALASR